MSFLDTEPSPHMSRRSRRSLVSLASSALPPPVHFDSHRIPDDQLKSLTNKEVRKFYMKQNDMIDRFLEVDHVVESLRRGEDPLPAYGTIHHDEENQYLPPGAHGMDANLNEAAEEPLLMRKDKVLAKQGERKTALWIVHLAINLSFFANVMLFATKVGLAFFSGSMAILASAFESFLDIVSNAIIFFTIRIIRHKDYYTYPVGKSRMEPLGIIVFAVIITTSFSQVLITSVERLTDPQRTGEELDLSPVALGILGANILIKALLWWWCATVRGSSSVEALAHDHENDVVFSIASTIFPVIGIWANMPWLDPVGAILLSIYIIYEWMTILLENIRRLTGQAASASDLQQLTYMAYRFSNKIVAVDTVRAYHIGDRLLVEIDIVLPPDCPLQEAHDVGEALQDALEMMDNVERAFVHLDYSSEHAIEHRRVVDGVGFGG
ncbi:cation efflux family-domain-containing protein [Radiomyces spectabilis]|uniref:cation efflux family-domain-containing protein n=1 Tax=Radiomyces spectabilis TaxID=64574 RepID=UPI00221FD69A|nr:cation efflux family-domain-containing protein [Radiomyces spectabilis]KAI8377802.1 cation efflux family-domain-containing protein [Radiomyces spectabilis]